MDVIEDYILVQSIRLADALGQPREYALIGEQEMQALERTSFFRVTYDHVKLFDAQGKWILNVPLVAEDECTETQTIMGATPIATSLFFDMLANKVVPQGSA